MSEDTISRQAAIDAASEGCFELRGVFQEIRDRIMQLPSAEPCTEQISKTYTDGFDDGYDQGWKDGQDALLDDQWERGREDEQSDIKTGGD